MGNQMFQLAFAHAASRRLRTRFAMGAGRSALWEHFAVGEWADPRLRTRRDRLFRLRHGLNPRRGLRPELMIVEQDDVPEVVLATLRDGVAYGGFFQSERWFSGYEDEIRELFTVLPQHREEFERRYPQRKPYICMHVRRGDYLDTGVWALPTSYFRDALATIDDAEGFELIVISDDPGAVREELSDLDGMRCESNPAMVDLQLLMHADVVITSNSSFSWWGAWLNQRPGVRVVTPRHWLGFAAGEESPLGVIPARWTQVSVRDAPLQSAP
jgi:hypothetical protein